MNEFMMLSMAYNVIVLKMLGVKRIERVLPTGTPLTVVGEVWCFYTSEKRNIVSFV